MSENRKFKGVWIDRSIWLLDSLSCVDKCLLTEIDSLDLSERHCFASNGYFAKFLGVSSATITRSIKKLETMGFIKTELVKSKNGTERTIISLLDPQVKMMRPPMQNDETPTSQNDAHNNTSLSSNTTSEGEEATQPKPVKAKKRNGAKIEPYTFTNSLGEELTVPYNKTEHDNLVRAYGLAIVETYYDKIFTWEENRKNKKKNYSATAGDWIPKDNVQKRGTSTKLNLPRLC